MTAHFEHPLQVSATFKRSMHASTTCKAVTLPDLPYAKNALEPIMCEETLDIHHGRHHAAYVNNLNGQIKDTDMDNMVGIERRRIAHRLSFFSPFSLPLLSLFSPSLSLASWIAVCQDIVEIMMKSWNNGSPAATFNNAAQVVNHTFFWESMAPKAGGKPSGDLAAAIDRDFGSFDEFKAQFSAAGATQFGSGWAWLSVNNSTKKLEVSKTPNAENPWVYGSATPILTMDVWEHAYYVDQRNKRPDYIASFYNLINWDAVAARYAAAL